jgi:GntR family transcriptional regulator
MMFDQGPIPLYYQIKNLLKSKILSQELKATGQFPSEVQLCKQFNVSRPTVRQALSELIKEGLIYRDRGRGTFVTGGMSLKTVELKDTIENLISWGKVTRIKVLDYKEILPPAHIATIFKIKKNEKVFKLELLRSILKGPFGYSFTYFPSRLGAQISPNELTETTELLTFIEEKLKTKAQWADQHIDVCLASKSVAKHLSVKPGNPLLAIERDFYGRTGSCMYASITYYRTDIYKYETKLTRT